MENVENYEYFPRKMNISRRIKGLQYSFMHIFPFLYVENFSCASMRIFCIFYILRKP